MCGRIWRRLHASVQLWCTAGVTFILTLSFEKKNVAFLVLRVLSHPIKLIGGLGRPCVSHVLVQVWGARGHLSHYCGWCSCAWGVSSLIFGRLWRISGYIECGWFRIWLATLTAQENQYPPIKSTWRSLECIFMYLLSTGPVHFCSPMSPPLAHLENSSMVRKPINPVKIRPSSLTLLPLSQQHASYQGKYH